MKRTLFSLYQNMPRSLLYVLLIALAVRLISLWVLPSRLADDSGWYLQRGELIITNTITGWDFPTFAPLYALLAGTVHHLFGNSGSSIILHLPIMDTLYPVAISYNTIMALRLLQIVLGTITCGLLWRLAYRLTGDTRIATIAGLGLALNPIFIIENNQIVTETLFILLMVWALCVNVERTIGQPRHAVATGALLALASLTRAQTLLYPVGLALHLLLTQQWKRAARAAVTLLLVYVAVVSVWTVYGYVKFRVVVFGASGISDFLLAGAFGYKGTDSVEQTYAQLNQGTVPQGEARDGVVKDAVVGSIKSDPVGYLSRRIREVGGAVLQPHNTTYFPGDSLKDMSLRWLREDRSVGGLIRLIADPTFLPKLLLYVAHYLALIFGAIGILLTLREWRKYAPLTGFVAYILLLHFFLLAIPRYIFPITPVLWVFAAIAMVRLWERRKQPKVSTPVAVELREPERVSSI